MKKTHFTLWYLLGFVSCIGLVGLTGSTDILLKLSIYPYHGYIYILRWLSSQGLFAQMLAWGLYLGGSFLPLIIMRKKKNQTLKVINYMFTFFLLFATFGTLNNFFINPEIVREGIANLENIRFVIHGAITIIIVFFCFWNLIVSIQAKKETKIISKKTVKYVLSGVSFIIGTTGYANIAHASTTIGADILVEVPVVLVFAIRSLLLIGLINAIITSVMDYLENGLSNDFNQQFEMITKLAKDLLNFSVVSTIGIYCLKLLLMAALVDASFEFTLPLLEMGIAASAYVSSRIIAQSVALDEENRQFV